MNGRGTRRRRDPLIPLALKAELRRDACVLALADSRRRLQAGDVAARSIESSLLCQQSEPLRGASIDPTLELLRRELRSRQQRALREAVERVDRLRSEVEAARSTLLREQGLFAALDALVRSRRRDAEQHEARMTQTEIDDDWLPRPRVSLSGEGR